MSSTAMPVIESIDLMTCRVPLPEGPWGDQIHHVTDIEVAIVDVRASNGLVGTGFSHTSGWCGATISALIKEIIPDVIGQCLSPRALWDRSYKYIHDVGGAGVTTHALSALDIAYWDLLGKTLNVPIVDLLGRVRDRVPLYGSGINLHMSVEEVIEQVRRWKARGYLAAKVKVGKPDLAEDVERLIKIQRAVPGFPLAVDANQGWNFPQALRAFKLFEPLNLLWIEEPLPSDNITGHQRLRERTNTPIARAHNLPMTPHFVLELSASLLAAVPNVSYAEVTDGGRWQDLRIVLSADQEVDGYYVPSERPGHGIILDRDYLYSHKI